MFLCSVATAALLLAATGVAAAQQTQICSGVTSLHVPQPNGGELVIIKTSPPGVCEPQTAGSVAFDVLFTTERVVNRMLGEYYRNHPKALSKIEACFGSHDKSCKLPITTPASGVTVVAKEKD
ncbi:MAG: hypothetical protein Q7R90_01400 [bacterium]|nr:hypothetical protein [bacterium]